MGRVYDWPDIRPQNILAWCLAGYQISARYMTKAWYWSFRYRYPVVGYPAWPDAEFSIQPEWMLSLNPARYRIHKRAHIQLNPTLVAECDICINKLNLYWLHLSSIFLRPDRTWTSNSFFSTFLLVCPEGDTSQVIDLSPPSESAWILGARN